MEKFFYDTIKRGTLEPGECWQYLLVPSEIESQKYRAHRNCMGFHFVGWLHANPEVTNFGYMVSHENGSPVMEVIGQPIVVIFGRKTDFNSFKRYVEKIKRWFPEDDIQDTIIPQCPKSGTHRLTYVSHNDAIGVDPATFEPITSAAMELWAWIVKNCRRPVYRTSLGFAFSSERDALHFKMMHG